MIVVDACVLIAQLDASDARHIHASTLLLDAAEHPLAASSITMAEVLARPARAGKADVIEMALQVLEVQEVPIARGSAGKLAGLRARTGLKLPDCCVLLAAEQVRADAVLTFDEQLRKHAEEHGYGWSGA